MEDWIRSLVNSATAPFRGLIDAASKRIAAVWSTISGFLSNVRRQWQNLRARVTSWATIQIRHAQAVALTLKWFVFTYVPRKLGQLAVSLRTWTADLISTAEAKAKGLFDGLQQWAVGKLRGLLGLLDTLRTWAMSQIGGLLDTVGRIGRQVFGVLSTPERLAAWIIDAMISALIKWAEQNAHRVESLIAAKRQTIWRLVITVIEDVLHDIL